MALLFSAPHYQNCTPLIDNMIYKAVFQFLEFITLSLIDLETNAVKNHIARFSILEKMIAHTCTSLLTLFRVENDVNICFLITNVTTNHFAFELPIGAGVCSDLLSFYFSDDIHVDSGIIVTFSFDNVELLLTS